MTISSIAFAFGTGSAPGMPRQTGQIFVFGSPPNSLRQPQNILRLGLELDVTLDADDRLVLGAHARTASTRGLRASACFVARS